MANQMYYPGRSTIWDTVSQRRALGQPYSPELVRAGMEGERMGELSAYYSAYDKFRARDLAQKQMDQQNTQFYSSQANTNANLDKQIANTNMNMDKQLGVQENSAKYGTLGQLAVAGGMLAGGNNLWSGAKGAYNWMFPDVGIDPLTASEGMLPAKAASLYGGTPESMYSGITQAGYDTGALAYDPSLYGGSAATAGGTGMASGFAPGAAPMGYGAMDAGAGAASGMGAGMGFMNALPGIGTAMAGTAALGMGVVEGIKGLDRLIWGAPHTIQDDPTEKLLASYKENPSNIPVYNELLNRGVQFGTPPPANTTFYEQWIKGGGGTYSGGLNSPTGSQMDSYYKGLNNWDTGGGA